MTYTATKRIALAGVMVIGTLAALTGCGEDPPPPPPPKHDFTVEVEVTDTDENPLPSVPVELDGQVVGYTDNEGKFSGTLTEKADTKVRLAVKDIPGYRFVSEEETWTEETLKTTTVNGKKSGVPVFLQAQAESITKDYLVWVEAKCDDSLEDKCEDLPVLLNGEEVARTNALGFAHFSFDDVPQNDVTVTIDTPEPDGDDEDAPKFEPADPKYDLTLDLDSHIYLVEETFENPGAAEAKKRKRRPRRRRRAKRRKSRPKKAKAAAKKKTKSEGKGGGEDGVIDLW